MDCSQQDPLQSGEYIYMCTYIKDRGRKKGLEGGEEGREGGERETE
jgi:hypothetical protein